MSLSRISCSNKEKEKQTIFAIYKAIDNNSCSIFNSGAGAGKTYALKEGLKYTISKYEEKLKNHNQKIICITYTKVATDEVKERLGNTALVLVSTIHKRVWDLIKNYQKELVDIHKNKLKEEIEDLEMKIQIKKEFERYCNLGEGEKNDFLEIMIKNKSLFYENYNGKANEIREVFKEILKEFPEILKSISKFKKIVSAVFKIYNYTKCCDSIDLNQTGYKSVNYNSMYNRDMLHKMRISHDTLLEYGEKIITKYSTLKQIIIDKYPYIFIDEYQDTNEKVISIMNCLQDYAKEIGHHFYVGYFGDSAQNIYSDGVGEKITEIHPSLKEIKKIYNRRSTEEIIRVINKIRDDDIKQRSIFEDSGGGSVKFYTGDSEISNDFIDDYCSEWNIDYDNQLHCLVLTNETVANYSGFGNIYQIFKETSRYSGINYNQLNTELLSKDLSRLGNIPLLLFRIIQLKNNLNHKKTSVEDIISKDVYCDMNIGDLRKLIELLKENDGKTLGDYIGSLLKKYVENSNEKYRKVIESILDLEEISYMILRNHLLEELFPNLSSDEDENIENANTVVQKLLDINISEYDLWYKYIMNIQDSKVVYHTYHGTKGLEFNNIIIIMENAFGRSKNWFNFFFKNYIESDELKSDQKDKYRKIQNLLYVSCSRAIKNLRILYTDNITGFNEGIEKIFGEVKAFPRD